MSDCVAIEHRPGMMIGGLRGSKVTGCCRQGVLQALQLIQRGLQLVLCALALRLCIGQAHLRLSYSTESLRCITDERIKTCAQTSGSKSCMSHHVRGRGVGVSEPTRSEEKFK